MDHSPIRQTFELGKFISTARKSIIDLVQLRSLVEKYRKMWKIQSSAFLYLGIRASAFSQWTVPQLDKLLN